MAYYQDAPKKRRKTNYGETGSWDEEGMQYRDRKNGKRENPFRNNERIKLRKDPAGRMKDPRSDPEGRQYGRFPQRDNRRFGPDSQQVTPGSRSFQPEHKPGDRAPRPEEFRAPMPEKEKSYRSFEYRNAEHSNIRKPFIPGSDRNDAFSEDMEKENDRILCGRNPIREALRSGREIEKILVQKGDLSGSAREIVKEAKEKKIMVQEVDKRRLDEIALHHQGLIAFASAYAYAEVEDMLAEAERRQEAPFLIILDGVTDPHNLGAIIRTAECVGAHGVIIPMHRSVGLTPAAVKSSAGAIEHMKVARVINLNRTIDDLKKQGVWTYAVTMNGKDFEKVDFRGAAALVIGAEGEGISRLTEERCDLSVSLPMKGALDSLNASVAAGVVMYRVLSCRRNG